MNDAELEIVVGVAKAIADHTLRASVLRVPVEQQIRCLAIAVLTLNERLAALKEPAR